MAALPVKEPSWHCGCTSLSEENLWRDLELQRTCPWSDMVCLEYPEPFLGPRALLTAEDQIKVLQMQREEEIRPVSVYPAIQMAWANSCWSQWESVSGICQALWALLSLSRSEAVCLTCLLLTTKIVSVVLQWTFWWGTVWFFSPPPPPQRHQGCRCPTLFRIRAPNSLGLLW